MHAPACPWLVWSFNDVIDVKQARWSHPHHSMTSLFVPMWSRVGILHIGYSIDPPVILPMCNRVEKGPSQLTF